MYIVTGDSNLRSLWFSDKVSLNRGGPQGELTDKIQIFRFVTVKDIPFPLKASNIFIDEFHDRQIEQWYRNKVLQ